MFFIENYQTVIGKNRLDLTIDLPPDLAIESDHTSKTKLEAYIALKVPELWIYDRGLKISAQSLSKEDDYTESLHLIKC